MDHEGCAKIYKQLLNMASRHLSRSIAMQTLYEWDFYGRNAETLQQLLERNIEEFGPGLDDKDFPRRLIQGVMEHIDALNKIIAKAAPEWPVEQINIVDRNILRLGLYELLYVSREEVPPKVAINEAIELAKSFGGESSGRFVNGVLGTVYREIGEPGKEHVKEKKIDDASEVKSQEEILQKDTGGRVEPK